jgi:integrase
MAQRRPVVSTKHAHLRGGHVLFAYWSLASCPLAALPQSSRRAASTASRSQSASSTVITETGLRVYKELMSMKKDQLDLPNAVVWIPDSKTPNGIAEVPLTPLAISAFRDQLAIAGDGPFLFPSDLNSTGHQVALRTVWQKPLRRVKVPYFRIYDL